MTERLTNPVPKPLRRLIGQPVSQIDTPALVVDLDTMTRNIARMAEFARKHNIRWRPHAKMHKSSALAKLQVQAGAVGVCVQKTAEAEVMAEGGVRDIYISNEVIALPKLERVAALAERLHKEGGQLSIAVDSSDGVARLAHAMNHARSISGVPVIVSVFVEIDVGHGRCGVPPGASAVALVHEINKHPALQFAGLQAYHGKAQHLLRVAERRAAIATAVQAVSQTQALMKSLGLDVPLVTGAGTGTFELETASGVYGELQTGSFMFMDADYAGIERDAAQPPFAHALFVKTQVMSVHETHAVCDAGHKSHAIDSGLPIVHPINGGEPALQYFNGGDEHGILRAAPGQSRLPALGDMLWLIPGHCDPTVNLHDYLIGVSGGLVHGTVERIIRVDARGALS